MEGDVGGVLTRGRWYVMPSTWLSATNLTPVCSPKCSIGSRFGIELVAEPNRRTELNEWLTQKVRPMFDGRVLQVNEDIMLKWRLLVEEGRKAGHTFSQPDLMIAATAIHQGLTVVTRDRSEFDKARLPVVNPWDGK
jgi:predicted nucleic acid-binding protein